MDDHAQHLQALQARLQQLEQENARLRAEREDSVLPWLGAHDLQQLLPQLADSICVMSPDMTILYANHILMGIPREQIVGTSGLDWLPPEQLAVFQDAMQRLATTGEPQRFELYSASGELGVWQDVRAMPILRDGKLRYIVTAAADLTPYRTLTRELEVFRNHMTQMLENIPLAAVVWDKEQRTIYWNHAAERIFGYSADEALGHTMAELIVPPEEVERRSRQFTRAVTEGFRGKRPPYRNRTRDGREIYCDWFTTPLHDADGNITGMAGFADDVTEKLRASEALAAATRAAEQSARAKSRFLANMSHEIRTPMNGILAASELLLYNAGINDIREYAEIINTSTRNLLTVVNDILDFSRIESGALSLEQIPVDLPRLLREALDTMRPAALQKPLTLALEINALGDCHILSDPVRIRQVLFNLLNNAIKFTPSGNITLSARAEMLRDGRLQLHIAVRDTGIGIPSDVQPHIFESFTQGDGSIARRYGGTGLGLAISRGIARLLGGDLDVTSTPGQGSEFTLCFQAHPTPAVAATADELQAIPASLHPCTVLLVDDNAVNLKVGSRLLQTLGLNVLTASNGTEAVALAASEEPDIILMDVHMPQLDGLDACRHIRALPGPVARAPIIAVSASVLEEERRRCQEAGMNDFLAKPFRLSELVNCLSPWIAHAGGEPPPA